MTATHQFIDGGNFDVTAWRYDPKGFIPVWVVRRFHDVGTGTLQAISLDGESVFCRPGDLVVAVDDKMAVVLTHAEFTKCFRELPKKGAK